jgi:TetR/AcrR family transcriptional regulator, cholesterol catabolism regulator
MSPPESRDLRRWEPTARWERRSREVLDAAAMIFAEKGYLGASTRDIAERLGIRQASLYYYFPSKEVALATICELGAKDFILHLREILVSPASGAEKIRAAMANHLSPLRSRPEADYIRVFLLHRHELPNGLRQKVAALAREYQNAIEELFVAGIARGDFRSDLDPKRAALAFLGLCNSVISARTLPPRSTIDDFINDYARIFTDGVLSNEALPSRANNEG